MQKKLKFSLKLILLTVLLVLSTGEIRAQQKNDPAPAPFNAAAYRIGERLTYNVSFSQFISAAHIELLVAARGQFYDRDGIQLRAHVETSGVVNVALFAVNNDYTTFVDPQSGLPYRSQQVVREAGRTSEASNDYNQPAGTAALSKQRAVEFPGTYDLLSALYRVRAMPLVEGGSYLTTVRSDNTEYQAEVKVTGREFIKTNVGSFNAIVTRVNLRKSPDYSIRVYFTDDEWHVPVLLTARHPSGEIRAELSASELIAPGRETARANRANPTNQLTPLPQDLTPISTPSPGSTPADTASSDGNGAPLTDLPFKVGEQLNYQVYLDSSPQPVGSVTFSVRARGRYFNREGLLFAAAAQTSAAGARVFPVTDQISSYVDPSTLLPFRTELALSEGKYRVNRSYNIDQNRGAAVSEKNERIEIPVGTHDLISLLYAIRTLDIIPPKKNAISIMATSQPRTLFINSQRRETIQVGSQKISAILVSLTTDDAQPDQMQIRIWIGDDSRHLPLRITAVTPLGSLRADLTIAPVRP